MNPHTARRHHTGAPDLLIVADGKAYFLKVKTKAGRVSQAQADCREKLRRAGAEVGVCRRTATEATQ